MRRWKIGLTTILVFMFAGLGSRGAEAATMIPAPEHYSLVETVGCTTAGRCPVGSRYVCRRNQCFCRACRGYRGPYTYRRPYVGRRYVRPYVGRPYVGRPYVRRGYVRRRWR